MSDTAKIVGMILVAILLLVVILFATQTLDWAMLRFWAPKYEQVRRETFEQTKSYNQGMIQELQNMQFEYQKADPEQKDALAKIILHRAADFPEDKLPYDLAAFIQKLKSEQGR